MRKSIAQFMWGFQPHFRNGLERVARDVFEQVGFGLGTRAFLVGFTLTDGSPSASSRSTIRWLR